MNMPMNKPISELNIHTVPPVTLRFKKSKKFFDPFIFNGD